MFPPAVVAMLDDYRTRLSNGPVDWGDELDALTRHLLRLGQLIDFARADIPWNVVAASPTTAGKVQVLASFLPDPLPSAVALVQPGQIRLGQPLPLVIPGRPLRYLVLDTTEGSAGASDVTVEAGHPGLHIGGEIVRVADVESSGRVRLISDAISRWSVQDRRGGGWFPNDALPKYDGDDRPYFHGNDLVIEMPVGIATITVGRGVEFGSASVEIEVIEGEEIVVELTPGRLYDAAASGWYGCDLHVHMNYSGDLVCTPDHVQLMQAGERLHILNLVAANWSRSLVYDREAFEHFCGQDLPWSTASTVARWGVEYRNDLFGHFHALDPGQPPMRYQTGHERSDEPQDWPPNAAAALELRESGASIGYTHPVSVPLDVDHTLSAVFSERVGVIPEARELVADAALGLVDSVDLTGGKIDLESTTYLYHRLLGCGLRLAATAGTDAMLSQSRFSVFSNPPGWSRAYAHLGDEPLSVSAWKKAVRDGRTFATNGPWLELAVNGVGPGGTIASTGPTACSATARVTGLGVERLAIVGPNGVVQSTTVDGQVHGEVEVEISVNHPTWLAAMARGGNHRSVPGAVVYAHTSPVWIDIDGHRIARGEDARWCLDWLERFETMVRARGNFTQPHQLDDFLDTLERARDFYDSIASG